MPLAKSCVLVYFLKPGGDEAMEPSGLIPYVLEYRK